MSWLPEFDDLLSLLGYEKPKTSLKKFLGKDFFSSHHTYTNLYQGKASKSTEERFINALNAKLIEEKKETYPLQAGYKSGYTNQQEKWIGFIQAASEAEDLKQFKTFLKTIDIYIKADIENFDSNDIKKKNQFSSRFSSQFNITSLLFIAAYELDLHKLYGIESDSTMLSQIIESVLLKQKFKPIKYLFDDWRESYSFSIYKFSVPQIEDFGEIEMLYRDERTMDDWVAGKYVPTEENLFHKGCLNWIALIVIGEPEPSDKKFHNQIYIEYIKFIMACILHRIINSIEEDSEALKMLIELYSKIFTSLSNEPKLNH